MLAALAAAGFAGGCGEDPPREPAEELEGASEEEREAAERAEAAEHVPEADRVAYYQLATIAGQLRARAATVVSGGEPRGEAGRAALAAARERLAGLDPLDEGLGEVRGLLRELSALAGGPIDRGEAARLLDRLPRVERALDRYLRERAPANASLLPD